MRNRPKRVLESKLRPQAGFRASIAVILSVVAISFGIFVIFRSHAAGPSMAFEPETKTVAGSAITGTDAAASGGGYVQFKAPAGGIAKPIATNTGWQPTGVTLTPMVGNITITTDGTVIDSKDISGYIHIQANNVTIKRSRLKTTDYTPIGVASGYTNITITDNEIDGLMGPPDGGTKCIAFNGAAGSILRNNIYYCEDGMSINGDGALTISQNYVHDLKEIAIGGHNDGIEFYSGSGRTITYNNLDNTGGTTSAFNFTNDYGAISNNTLSNNWLTGGSYNLYVRGDGMSKQLISNLTITGNRFTRNSADNGPLSTGANYPNIDVATIRWSGNVYDDNGEIISF